AQSRKIQAEQSQRVVERSHAKLDNSACPDLPANASQDIVQTGEAGIRIERSRKVRRRRQQISDPSEHLHGLMAQHRPATSGSLEWTSRIMMAAHGQLSNVESPSNEGS